MLTGISQLIFTGEPINHGGALSLSPAGLTGVEKIQGNYTVVRESSIDTPTTSHLNNKYQYEFSPNETYNATISVNSGTTGTIVSAIAGKQIEITSMTFITDTATSIDLLSNNTNLVSGMSFPANGGMAPDDNNGLLKTEVGEAFKMYNLSGEINGFLTYRVV